MVSFSAASVTSGQRGAKADPPSDIASGNVSAPRTLTSLHAVTLAFGHHTYHKKKGQQAQEDILRETPFI